MDTQTQVTPATPVAAVTIEAAAPVVAVITATSVPAVVAIEPAKKNNTLAFPSGSFTHTDLARANGKTNQQVWQRYQIAVKSGFIIRDGERKPAGGKGKPSLLWKLNPNYVASAVPTTPVVDVTHAAPVAAADPNLVLPTEAQMEAAADAVPVVEAAVVPAEPVIETAVTPAAPEPPKDEPPTAPPAATNADEQVVTVEVARVEATPEVANLPEVEPVAGIAGPVVTPDIPAETPIEEPCPACQHKLVTRNDATGVLVGCNQPAEICHTAERVEAHGNTIKSAIATLHDKWDKLVAAMNLPLAAH